MPPGARACPPDEVYDRLAAAAADLCGTGYPDIVMANVYGVAQFLCNRGGESFEEVGAEAAQLGRGVLGCEANQLGLGLRR